VKGGGLGSNQLPGGNPMSVTNDVRQIRWWKPWRFPPEPSGLHRLLVLGIVVGFVGLGAAAGMAIRKGLWKEANLRENETCFYCPCQRGNYTRNKKDIEWETNNSEIRLRLLKHTLLEEGNPSFLLAREKAIEEERFLEELKAKLKGLKVSAVRDDMGKTAAALGLSLGFAFLIGRLMLVHCQLNKISEQAGEKELANWIRPYWFWVLLLFTGSVIREVFSSVLIREKTWFGWVSFCVCKEAWFLLWIMYFGLTMTVAYPACIAWCLGRSTYRPRKLDFDAPDGAWGVGDYVQFLQTWSGLIILAVIVPSVLLFGLLLAGHFSWIYVFPSIGLLLGGFVVAGRLIWNAVEIHRMYVKTLGTLGTTWSGIQQKKPPPDPTADLFGKYWWQIPPIVGALEIGYAILKGAGVMDYLIR
jgi:hypothetical protein